MEILSDTTAARFLKQVPHMGPAPDYDWDKLFGKLDHWILLTSEKDFNCTPKSMRNQLYREGQKRGVTLKIHVLPELIISDTDVKRHPDLLPHNETIIKRCSIMYRDKATL